MSLSGKVCVVTGAARGIGAETARGLAAQGATLALVGLEPELLAEVAAGCGPKATFHEADTTDGDAVARAFAEIAERHGRIDVLMANAGVAMFGALREMSPDAFARQVDVNLTGTFRCVHAALEPLIASRGYMLIVASVSSITPVPGLGAYAASKAGVESLGESLRSELAHHGVDVGVAYYSWISTDLVEDAYAHPGYVHMREAMQKPFDRSYPPSQVAAATVKGIEARARTIDVPRWVGAMRPPRQLLARVADRDNRKMAAEVERLSREEAERLGAEAAVRPRGRSAAGA